jgi:RimJ/RimL family protein N-acetyltransferase
MHKTERPVGEVVAGWTQPRRPDAKVLTGRYAVLERLDAERHAGELHAANSADDSIWDYLPYGPFADVAAYHAWLAQMAAGSDPVFYAIRDMATGRAAGVASYLRVTPEAGSIEVGHINYSKELQQTKAATETMFLMMDWAFGAGYRRYEWKCDALNRPSRRAAIRLGFSYEGIFRQAAIVKGRNRDTAWFAVIDKDWPALRAAYQTWLDPANFDADDRQRQSLSDLTAPVIVMRDPG